jgi:hypothetical protein
MRSSWRSARSARCLRSLVATRMHQSRTSLRRLERAAVIANFEAISSTVSAPPAPVAIAASASAKRPGGFASTLAAVQSLAPVPQTQGGEVETLDGPAAGSLQFKKLNSSSPVAAAAVAAANVILPGFIPAAANQVPLGPPQTNVQQLNLSPTLTSFGQIADDAAAPVPAGLQKSAYEAAPQNPPTGYSMPSQTAATVDSSVSIQPGAGNPSPSPLGILVSYIGGQTSQQETSNATCSSAISTAAGRATSDDVLSGIAPLAGSMQPAAPSSTSGEHYSGAPVVQITTDNRGSASASRDTGLGSPESVLLANANLDAGITAGAPLFSAAEPQTVPANSATGVTANLLMQVEVSAQAGTENAPTAILSGENSDSTASNPAAHPVPGTPVLRIAAARVAGAIAGANIRGSSPRAVSNASLSSAGSSALNLDNALPMASQTPFSVFFSGPGPGAESAASTLPKMILPAASAAIRESHGYAPSQPTNAATGEQSAVPQVAAPQNAKDSLAGTDAWSLQAGQPMQRNAEPIAASAPVASVQAAAAQVPAGTPISAAVTALPQTSLPAEAPPRSDTLPGTTPSAPATVVLPAAETLPAAAAGTVQLAQLINRAEQSEMRIGMNTSAFGSVEVRAVVHASDVGLVIGSEKGDLRSLLANEMPAITNTLQQQSLRLNSVNFMQGFAFSNNASGGGDSQQRSFVPARGFVGSQSAGSAPDDSMEVLPAAEFGGGSGGLSILA